MDRAWTLRSALRRIILIAVVIQATTPDRLDLSLLHLLSGADAYLTTSVARDSFKDAVSRIDRDQRCERSASIPEAKVEQGSPASLCEPIWPELALNSQRRMGDTARLKQAITDSAAMLQEESAIVRRQPSLGSASAIPLRWRLERMTC